MQWLLAGTTGQGFAHGHPLAYFLAVRTGRPVKMVMDYVEEFTAGNPRHAAIIQLKSGVKRGGTIVAHQARVLFDSGAYGGFKPTPATWVGLQRPEGPIRSRMCTSKASRCTPTLFRADLCAPQASRRRSSPSSPISMASPVNWGSTP